MNDSVNDDVLTRIQNIYQSSSPQEQKLLKQILEEVSRYGDSQTYRDIWLADFKEVPVTIDEFICNPRYLGETNRHGEAVYPFWRDMLRDLFADTNKYNAIVLTGSTRVGKTSTSIVIAAYMLYRLMLYRNPHQYFQKKEVSRFTLAFANLTKELALSVAYREFNDTLKDSEWFMDHGRVSASDRNFYYIPEGDKIEIIPASDSAMLLGKQLWCLKGDTKLLTIEGIKSIEDCVNTSQVVFQYVDDVLMPTKATVICTKFTSEMIRVELDNGAVIEGTPEHSILLDDDGYKPLSELSSSDSLKIVIAPAHSTTKISSIEKIHYAEPIPVYDVIEVRPNHNFAFVSNDTVFISHNCCIMDETNFAKSGVKDINKAKQHMKNLYDTANARISGTFRLQGEVYGKLIASSSKNTDNDFLSDYIEQQQNAGNTHLYVVDEPQWKILPPSMFSDKVFHFTVGDRYKKGFVIPEENDDKAHHEEYVRQGYTVVEAPAELKTNFLADYDIALRDIAGISVIGAMGFITQAQITPNISDTRHNPFFTDTIQVGTQDNKTIEEFFRIDQVPGRLKHCLMNIHLDLSETGDRTGMCGVCVDGEKIVTDFDNKKVSLPFFREVFSVGIDNPPGDRLSFQKVVNFIYWLRRNGFTIGTISTDQYQSSYLREVLSGEGFKTSKISVDRSEDPYIGLRNILNDQRIELIRNEVRDIELINLQRTNNKIDHKPDGCFTADTRIRLVDGRSLTISELMIEQQYKTNWVYTFNETLHKIEPKPIKKVFQTKAVTQLVKVTLDSGDTIYCTPEHRFMLRDGSYEEIQNLTAGVSLMPLYTKLSEEGLLGYRLYYEPMEDAWHYEHRQFVDTAEPIARGNVVHHCNYNKLDNCPTNLQLMTSSEHMILHNNNTHNYNLTSESLKQWHKESKGTTHYANRSKKISEAVTAHNMKTGAYQRQREREHQIQFRISEIERIFDVDWSKLTANERNSYGARYSNMLDTDATCERYREARKKVDPAAEARRREVVSKVTHRRRWYTNGSDTIYLDVDATVPEGYYPGRTLSAEHVEAIKSRHIEFSPERRKAISLDTSNRIWITNGVIDKYIYKDADIPEGFVRGRTCTGKNHKIISIEYIHSPCFVYDLEIQDNHNFALDAGVFVHNSKDIADCLCGACYTLTTEHAVSPPPPASVAKAIAAVNQRKDKSAPFNMFPDMPTPFNRK